MVRKFWTYKRKCPMRRKLYWNTRKVVAITDSCSSNEHPCTQQCADDATKAKCELKQAKKNMHPRFAIAFDNTWIFIESATR